MTPLKEKVATGRITGEPGIEGPEGRKEAPNGGRELEGRRAGLLLIVIGCVLMALAAGEAAADTTSVGATGTPAPVSAGLVP